MASRTALFVAILAVVSLFWAVSARPASADDWHPVSPGDLTLKDNPKQPGADAMVLYRQVDVDAKNASVNNYFQIKVFTAAGVKEQSDVEIAYNKAEEKIQSVRARTIQPDGTITEFNGQTFDKEIVKGRGIKYLAKTFTLADVHPGSVIEYQYREQYDDNYYWNLQWTVQHSLYTRDARFSIKPDTSSYALQLLYRLYNLPDTVRPQKAGSGIYTLEVQDIQGIETEDLMPPPALLESKVEFYYHAPDEPERETTAQYWNRIAKKWDGELERFIDKKKQLDDEVSHIVADGDTPEQKLQKIYDRTLQIRNLTFEDEKTDKEAKQENIKDNQNVEDVLKHGYGRELEVNWLLIGLARAAGFDATEVRVAPRSDSLFVPDRQASEELTDDLVWVHAGAKDYFLDAGAHYYAFGHLPWSETGIDAVRVTKDGAQMVGTPEPQGGDNTIVRHADVKVDNSLAMTGTIKVDFTGEDAASLRRDERNEDESGRKSALGNEVKSWLPVGATFEVTSISNWPDVEKPLHVEGTFSIPSPAAGSFNRLLLPLEIFQTSEYSSFEPQKRVNAVYFSYPYEKNDDIVIHAPLGYAVQSLPPAQDLNRGAVDYKISAANQADGIEVERHLLVNGFFYGKEAYPTLRAFFSAVKTDDDAQALLQNSTTARNN
jgi:Domain of Unknown Function with PDB structure (DUF3857)